MSLWKYLSQHNPWYKMTGLQVETVRFVSHKCRNRAVFTGSKIESFAVLS